jgi:DNA-binding CsgD family transcriptional regulator
MQVPLGRAALVGRAEELAEMLQACRSGPGGVTLLSGDAGSGKTRLLGEVSGRAALSGAMLLRGHAVPAGGAFRPLAEALARAAPARLVADERIAPFRSVLARVLPSWPRGSAAGAHVVDPVVVMGEALLELMAVISGEKRCVVVLDDLHWADRDTLAVLEYLAGGLAGLPVRVLAAARADEDQPDGLVVLGRRIDVQVIALTGLSPAEIAVLARSAAGADLAPDVERFLVDAADGLPLLVEEVFAGLAEAGSVRCEDGCWRAAAPLGGQVPGAFADAVGRRVASLEPGQREVLLAAAVLGRGVPWELLPVITGAEASTVAAALRAGVQARLLVADPHDGGALRWRHALTQDAVLAGLTAPERAALAAGAAQVLDSRGEPLHGSMLALVADLYAQAGARERAAELMLALATEHAGAGALATASSLLERAAALAAGHPGLQVLIAVERVHVLALGARTDEAVRVGDETLTRAAGADRTALAVALARACVAAERFADAACYLDAADDHADARVLSLSAHVALGTGQLGEALRRADAAVSAAEDAGLPEVVCEALEIAGRGRRHSAPAASREAFLRAERVAARHGLTPWRIRALSELGINDMIGSGDGESLRRAKELALEAGMPGTAIVMDLHLIGLTMLTDGVVAGMTPAERCAEQARRLGLAGPQAHALLFAARGRAFADRMSEVDSLLDEAVAIAPDPVRIQAERFHVRGCDAWLSGDVKTAAREMDAAVGVLREAPVSQPMPVWGEWAVLRTAVDPADPGPREEVRASDVIAHASNAAGLHYADAVAAIHAGQARVAARWIAAGDDPLAGRPFHRCLLRALMLPVIDEPAVWLNEALAWLASTSEIRVIRWCAEQLRLLGQPVPRPYRDLEAVPPKPRAIGVTGRELQVLRLIADGLGNAEIAARLQLSRRTVETHVSNLLTKTGSTRRTALPDWLPR